MVAMWLPLKKLANSLTAILLTTEHVNYPFLYGQETPAHKFRDMSSIRCVLTCFWFYVHWISILGKIISWILQDCKPGGLETNPITKKKKLMGALTSEHPRLNSLLHQNIHSYSGAAIFWMPPCLLHTPNNKFLHRSIKEILEDSICHRHKQ